MSVYSSLLMPTDDTPRQKKQALNPINRCSMDARSKKSACWSELHADFPVGGLGHPAETGSMLGRQTRSNRATVSTCSVNGKRLNAVSAARRSLPSEVRRAVSLRNDSSPQLTYTKRSGGYWLRYSVSSGSRPLRGGSAITTCAPDAAKRAAPAGPVQRMRADFVHSNLAGRTQHRQADGADTCVKFRDLRTLRDFGAHVLDDALR